MLRDRNLVPLSHQHQHVLALCVRLDRALQAGAVDVESWQAEIQAAFEHEICIHFAAEEKVLFPLAEHVPDLRHTIEELVAEHRLLRAMFQQAADRKLDAGKLGELVHTLAHHIRKEEHQLFEALQDFMTPEELSALGAALGEELASVPKQCSMRQPPKAPQE